MHEDPSPLERFVSVALRMAMAVLVLLAGVRSALVNTGLSDLLEFLIGALEGAVVVALAVGVLRVGAKLLVPLGAKQLATLAGVLLAVTYLSETSPETVWRTLLDRESWSWPTAVPNGLASASIATIVLAIACVCGWFAMLKDRRHAVSSTQVGGLAMLSLGLVAAALYVVVSLASDGVDPYPTDYRTLAHDAERALSVSNPSNLGPYTIEALSYGYGANERRPAFGRRRTLESRAVDATPLLPEWKGIKKEMRERYWGFGLDAAPLNGLVWAPEGAGPFPLVLIVHGNHSMEEVSDPGYAYLGRLIASHGMIAVSVDENYINGSWSGDFRGKEMALRAWLLLEHLSLWRDWNASGEHRFAQRVDMDRIALVGHSRGGEALPIAHTMNRLERHPDDATVHFDYGFAIRSLVAIAQVDQRYHRRLELEDVNFLALQGSYDSDEPAFHGLRQFNRTVLNDDAYRFKAGVYVHGANHGQFNSIWGREDFGAPEAWLLNLAPLIAAEDQQQVAKVYINAFLMATLQGREEYLPLFRDPRVGAAWLPDLAFVHQYSDSTVVPIANFEEDLDVSTGSAPGAAVRSTGLSVWRENELEHRDERLQGSSAVVLGWNGESRAHYEIELPAVFWDTLDDRELWLTLSVSGSTERPRTDGEDDERTAPNDDERPPAAPEFSLELEDYDGTVAALRATDIAHLAPPLRVRYLKHTATNEERYNAVWEPVLQYLEVPLERLWGAPGAGASQRFRYLRLRFDDVPAGMIIVDDIALRRASLAPQPESLIQSSAPR